MKGNKNPRYIEFQPIEVEELLEDLQQSIPADVFSEPRIPIRSNSQPTLDNSLDSSDSEFSNEPVVVFDDSLSTAESNLGYDSDTTDFNATNSDTTDFNTANSDITDSNIVDSDTTTATVVEPKTQIYDNLTFNAKKTIMTAAKDFEGDIIDLANFDSTVKKVNANKVQNDLEIIGNDNDNSLRGGRGDDTLSGGEGDDILTGGKGDDTFVYQSGDDFITDYAAKNDKIKLENGTIKYIELDGKNVVFSFEEGGTLTVKNGKNKNITLVDKDGNETTEKFTARNIQNLNLADMWFNPDVDNFANTDTQQVDSLLKDTENYSSISKPEEKSKNPFAMEMNDFHFSMSFSFGGIDFGGFGGRYNRNKKH